MEVYLLGVIVAYVKLQDLASIELSVAIVAFVGTVLLACEACDQVVRADAGHLHGLACPRCGTELHRRKPDSLNRTTALVLTAAILYIPANLLPVLTVISFGQGAPSTIVGGVIELVQASMLPVAILVFFASILVPVLKLFGLVFLLISVRWRWTARLRDRTRLYRIIEGIGRWSMVDVFMTGILAALVALGNLATITAGAGAIAFCGVVIVTIFASMSFDPRLMWDAANERNAEPSPLRV
jgi:paraquat-inducible protein A